VSYSDSEPDASVYSTESELDDDPEDADEPDEPEPESESEAPDVRLGPLPPTVLRPTDFPPF
jgi:hypothetical protein